MSKPRLLDLFCGAGGAAMGYHRAGFEVVGVDIAVQKHYPFEFIQADAMTYQLEGFDAIHASPVCKGETRARHKVSAGKRTYPDFILPMLDRLAPLDIPWIVENVEDTRKLPGAIMLCGSMFGLGVKRHRLFQSNILLFAPGPCRSHAGVISIFGHDAFRVVAGQRIGYTAEQARSAMGIDWMPKHKLSDAIPPAYTLWLGRQLMAAIEASRTAA